ncbi:TetR/AcrR family transcriptional regulator [Janthinobacterium agaricidamnosum]|nr:TetR/AcrR family transcriptional regulator [Janthinobacterium agaricidamnosum]
MSRKKKETALDRERIAAAALALIDAEGIDQLSMRKLGASLGVEAMTLYYYFTNKAELLDGVTDCLLELVESFMDPALAGLERIRQTFHGMRRLSIEHPQAFLAMVQRRFRTRRALEFYEHLLQAFADAGATPEQSARYYRMLANFSAGAGIAEVGSRALQPHATPIILEDFNLPEVFPRVTEVAPHLRVPCLGPIFASGLELILGQLQAELSFSAS